MDLENGDPSNEHRSPALSAENNFDFEDFASTATHFDMDEEGDEAIEAPETGMAQCQNGAEVGEPESTADIVIKQEYPESHAMLDNFISDEVIDLSDTDDEIRVVSSNFSKDGRYKHGTTMEDGTIMLSDRDEDDKVTIVYDDGSTAVTIKQEDPDIELLGANKGLVALSDSDTEERGMSQKTGRGRRLLPGLNPKAKRSKSQIAKMMEIQKAFAQRALANTPTSGARRIAEKFQSSTSWGSGPVPADEYAWMQGTSLPNNGPAVDFVKIKSAYKAKRKARKNTLEDDVQFKKAQQVENERLKKLAQEAADSDSEEADESDDGLFVPWGGIGQPCSKRPYTSMIDAEEEDDENATNMENVSSKKSRSGGMASTINFPSRRARAKAREQELRSNMLAGIEAILLKDQKRDENLSARNMENADECNALGATRNVGKKPSKAGKPPTRTGTRRMNNVNSLLNSNVYEDSNANLGCSALPVITERKKKEFLSTLIASIPLEDRKQARSDKVDVEKASQMLSSRHVKPDGKGNWILTGMKSSLFHYQVQGSACMKKRETGNQAPYGGILADQMGLGKTVMTIATMIANRPSERDELRCTLIVCSPALMAQCKRYKPFSSFGLAC